MRGGGRPARARAGSGVGLGGARRRTVVGVGAPAGGRLAARLGAGPASRSAPVRRRRRPAAGGRRRRRGEPWIWPSARSSVALQRRAAVEAGGDDGDPHLVAEGVVDDGAEDDVGLGVRGLLDQPGRLVDLEQAEVASRPGSRAARRGRRRCWPRAAGWRSPARRPATARSSPRAEPMPMSAEPAPCMTDLTSAKSRLIRPGRGDQVGDALDTGQQHLVGAAERVEHADRAVADRQQPVVRDDDEGVDLVAQRRRCRSRPGRRGDGPRR